MIVLGIMSGSSLDGLDFALCEMGVKGYDLLGTANFDLSESLELTLRASSQWSFIDFLNAEKRYTDFVADCILEFIKKGHKVDLVSVHGHTTYHIPEKGLSHQLLNGGRLSALTNHSVCCDFRTGDIALGGKGTPLVPIAERKLFNGYDYYLNLGGIANLTDAKKNMAFDVSPCNQLLNCISQRVGLKYDEGGRLASQGNMLSDIYTQLSDFEYYKSSPPKSLDNNWIRENYFSLLENVTASESDLLYTTSQWITDRIHEQIDFTNKETSIYITGGGAHNAFFIECLSKKLKEKNCIPVIPSEEIIDYKEAILLCLLGYLRFHNQENVLSDITGAKRNSIGGALYHV